MDPVSQGILGAAAAQSIVRRSGWLAAACFGFLAGMAADLDILISSNQDPLLFLTYHRQFTHSLIFIPVGGLFCALVMHSIGRKFRIEFRQTWLFCTIGYATHALLDACTSYGTQLLWPFTTERFAWSIISIVDPLFTIPMLILVGITLGKRNNRYARLALLWAIFYLSVGLIQHQRAEIAGLEVAASRGHEPERMEVKPSFGNLMLWKVIYEYRDRFYVDGIRVAMKTMVYPGQSVPKLNIDADFPWLNQDSQQASDIQRFSWFSNGYVSVDQKRSGQIIDTRYSVLPNRIDGLWRIELDPGKGNAEYVRYIHDRGNPKSNFPTLWRMILGIEPKSESIPGNADLRGIQQK